MGVNSFYLLTNGRTLCVHHSHTYINRSHTTYPFANTYTILVQCICVLPIINFLSPFWASKTDAGLDYCMLCPLKNIPCR